MNIWMRLFRFYLKRTLKDYFTIGYSLIFPLVMIGLIGWLRKGSYGQDTSSFAYYTVALVPFCICFELATAAYLGQEEARKKVAERFLISPISTRMLLIVKWSAGVTAMSVCHGFVYLIAKLVLGVSYHGYGVLVFLMSISFTALIYGIGLWLGLGMKNFIVLKNLINIPIFLFGVLGGCFYPFGSLNVLINALIKLSPITFINRAAFLAIYDSDAHLLGIMTLLFIILSIGAITMAIHRFKREAFCNGDMFSYEK